MKNPAARAQLESLKRSNVVAPKIDLAPSAAPAKVDADPSVMSTVASGPTTKDAAHGNEKIDHASHGNNGKSAVKDFELDMDAITRKASASASNANAASGNSTTGPGKGNEKAKGASSKTDENPEKDDVASPADKRGAVTFGTTRDDVLTGTEKGDRINGGNGNKVLNGGDGDDVLTGGNGNDLINGNRGNDYLSGGAGNDTIGGGTGDDTLVAGPGHDVLTGGTGKDVLLFTKDNLGEGPTLTTVIGGDSGDRIDLTDFGLHLVKGDSFTGTSGELLVKKNGSITTLLGDINGDGAADIEIKVIHASGDVLDMLVLSDEETPPPSTEDPVAVDPAPVNPVPVDPIPVNPTPVEPIPVESAPVEPVQAVMTATAQEDRVAQLKIPDSVTNGQLISSIRILEQPETGHVSVSPENGITLVMTDAQKGLAQVGFSYEVILADNTVVRVEADIALTPAQQAAGWGLGEGYMLATDAKGELILEHGDNHRKVFVSEGDHALTAEDICSAEGLDPAAMVGKWGSWLAKNPEYGASEDMALSTDLGMALWNSLTYNKVTSNWLLFERGYEYPAASRLIARASNGESELHPMVFTAYGEGEDPVIGGLMNVFQNPSAHIVVTGLNLAAGAQALLGTNLLLDNVTVGGSGGNFQSVNGLTIRNSDFVDIYRDAPLNDGDTWAQHLNRIGGTYITGSTGVRLENNLFDHNGWAEGYDFKLAAILPQPPSMYSHNIYIQSNNWDVTLVDNIIMRGASFGSQVRSGGFIEDNVYIDNNAAVNFGGGDRGATGEALGNYSLMNGNIITSAGHKRVSSEEGALSMGIDDYGKQSALIENIIAHLADPANAAEIAAKTVTHKDISTNATRFFNDTIVYKWAAGTKGLSTNPNKNIGGLDAATMDKTTIQQFASQLLGKEHATIADLAAALRAQAHGQLDSVIDADLIIAFFRKGFGLDIQARTEPETLVFTPDERGDGMRWDNRLNWSTDDLPGARDGDSVDLNGNAVHFGNQTVAVDNFDFGDFGKLTATSGKLSIDGDISVGDRGASLSIDRAGQVWIDRYRDSDMLEIDVAAGRFANKGDMVGTINMHVSNNAQALLATAGGSFDLIENSSLTLEGSRIRVGFDGNNGNTSVLRMHDDAMLEFTADTKGFATLGEFRSGSFGAAPDLQSAILLDGNLLLDLSKWIPEVAHISKTLIKADEILGNFKAVDVVGLADRNATLILDYDADEFRLVLHRGSGTGQIDRIVIGEASKAEWAGDPDKHELWQALHDPILTPVDDPLLF